MKITASVETVQWIYSEPSWHMLAGGKIIAHLIHDREGYAPIHNAPIWLSYIEHDQPDNGYSSVEFLTAKDGKAALETWWRDVRMSQYRSANDR